MGREGNCGLLVFFKEEMCEILDGVFWWWSFDFERRWVRMLDLGKNREVDEGKGGGEWYQVWLWIRVR